MKKLIAFTVVVALVAVLAAQETRPAPKPTASQPASTDLPPAIKTVQAKYLGEMQKAKEKFDKTTEAAQKERDDTEGKAKTMYLKQLEIMITAETKKNNADLVAALELEKAVVEAGESGDASAGPTGTATPTGAGNAKRIVLTENLDTFQKYVSGGRIQYDAATKTLTWTGDVKFVRGEPWTQLSFTIPQVKSKGDFRFAIGVCGYVLDLAKGLADLKDKTAVVVIRYDATSRSLVGFVNGREAGRATTKDMKWAEKLDATIAYAGTTADLSMTTVIVTLPAEGDKK